MILEWIVFGSWVTTCDTYERVSNNTCVACAAGTTNDAGDDASGSDTTCNVTYCAVNERISVLLERRTMLVMMPLDLIRCAMCSNLNSI